MANYLSINDGSMSASGVFGSMLSNHLSTTFTSPVRIDVNDRFSDRIYGEDTTIIGIQLNNFSINNVADDDVFTLTIRKSDNTEFSENFSVKDFRTNESGIRNVTWEYINFTNPFYLASTDYFTYSLRCNSTSTLAFFYGTSFYRDLAYNTTTSRTNVLDSTETPFETTTYNSSLDFRGNGVMTGPLDNDLFYFGLLDFTIEIWIKPSGPTGYAISYAAVNGATNGQQGGWAIRYNSGGGIALIRMDLQVDNPYNTGSQLVATGAIPNQWNFIAVSRISGITRIYINGNLAASSDVFSAENFYGPVTVFRLGQGSNWFPTQFSGLIFNPRITKGLGRYSTPLINVPTDLLRVDNQFVTYAGEYLYRLNQQIITDFSPSLNQPNVLTDTFQTINPLLTSDNPFNDPTKNSLVFQGGGSRVLGIEPDADKGNDFTIGTKDFTLDLWAKPTALGVDQQIFSNGFPNDVQGLWYGFTSVSPKMGLYFGNGSTWGAIRQPTTLNTGFSALSTTILNNWSQYTLTRRNGLISIYRNGQIIDRTILNTNMTNTNSAVFIGGRRSGNQIFNGAIFNTHFVNGTCTYPNDFTVPTSALSANSNTLLLLSTQNITLSSSVLDASNNGLIFYNNRGTLTSNNPFNNPDERSLYFDGVSNRLRILTAGNDFNLSANDFTIEMFVYTIDNTAKVLATSNEVNDNQGFIINTESDTTFTWSVGNGTAQITKTALPCPPLSGKWKFITLNRSNSTFYATVDGYVCNMHNVSGARLTLTNTNSSISIGGRYLPTASFKNMYLTNFNFVNGSTKYPLTSFETPSAALSAISGAVCLVNGTGLLNGTNGNIVDTSSSLYSISTVGFATQGNAGPNNGGNLILNGSTDYLIVRTPDTGLDFGTNSFTVELWVYPSTGYTSTSRHFIDTRTGTASGSWAFGTGLSNPTDGRISWARNNIVSINVNVGLQENQWNHIAYVRDNTVNIAAMFLNGNRITSAFDTLNYNFSSLSSTIGTRFNASSGFFNGGMSDIRVLNGTALYDINADTYTVPSITATNIANTKLLLNFVNASIFDQTRNNGFVTFNGATTRNTIVKYNPGSLFFSGSSNLVANSTQNIDLSTSDFTIEGWFYSVSSTPINTRTLFTVGNSHNDGVMLRMDGLFISNSATAVTNSEWISGANYTGTFPISAWTHVAVTRKDGFVSTWVNGRRTTSSYRPINLGGSKKLTIGGASHVTNNNFSGYIDDFRILKQVCLYESNFQVPTAPITPHANTKLLLNTPTLTSLTNLQTLSSPFGFGNSSSIALTGVQDGVYTLANTSSLTGANFTVEFWVYLTSTTNLGPFINTHRSTANTGININPASNTSVQWSVGNGTLFFNRTTNVTPLLSTWNHFALVKNGYVYTLYQNGSAIDAEYSETTPTFTNNRIDIGRNVTASTYSNFLMSNLRVLSGVALYNSNFSPATAEFTPVADTKLLLTSDNQNNYLAMSSLSSPYPGVVNSIELNGGEYVFLTNPTNFDFETEDFTIEFWFNPRRAGSPLVHNNLGTVASTSNLYLACASDTTFSLQLGTGNAITNSTINTVAGTRLLNRWTHVALVRSKARFTLYQNGSSIWTTTNTGSIVNSNNCLTFGSSWVGPTYGSIFITNIRVLNGTALYTSNFQPVDISSNPVTLGTVLKYDVLSPTLTYQYTNDRMGDLVITGVIKETGKEIRNITFDSLRYKNITVINDGVLSFPNNTSTSVTIDGDAGLLIRDGGTLNIGTKDNPIPSNVNHVLNFVSNGLTATNDSIINVYGSYKLPYTTSTTNAATGSKTFTVLDSVSTNWLSGDELAFIHPNNPSILNTSYDLLILSSFNDSNNFNTINGTLCNHTALSSVNLAYLNNIPNFANLTRNIIIKGLVRNERGSFRLLDNTQTNIVNTRFENFGLNSSNPDGLIIGTNNFGYTVLSGNVFYGDNSVFGSQIKNSTVVLNNLNATNNVFFAAGKSGIEITSANIDNINISKNLILSSTSNGVSLTSVLGNNTLLLDTNYIYDCGGNGLLLLPSNSINFRPVVNNLYSIGNFVDGIKLSGLNDLYNVHAVLNNDSGIEVTSLAGNYRNINSLYNKNFGISASFSNTSTNSLSNINASYNINDGLYLVTSNNVTPNLYNITANRNLKGIEFFNNTTVDVPPLNLNNIYLSGNNLTNLEIASAHGNIIGLSSFENSIRLSLIDRATLFDGICSYVTNNFDSFSAVPLTINGIVSSSSLSPYSDPTTTSMVFRGTPNSDYFTAPAFNISTDFTLEAWVRFPVLTIDAILDARTGSVAEPLWFGIDGGTPSKLRLYTGNGGNDLYASTGTISANVWHHLVWMRTNSRVYGFVDGVKLIDSPTALTNFANNVFVNTSFIGRAKDGTPVNKLISNLRISNAAIYPTTGFIAPSSAPFKNTSTTVFLLQDPYLYGINGTFIDSANVSISGGTNYRETYIRNSNIVRNNSSFSGYSLSLDSVNLKQFFLENSDLSGNNGDVAFFNTRDVVQGSYIFNNCKFSSIPLPFGVSTYQPNVVKSTGFAFTNFNRISSNNFSYLPTGTRIIDTIVYDTDSPDQISERLIPTSRSSKLRSGSKFVIIDNTEFTTVGVLVSKSSDYNGSEPRLILKRNASCGVDNDIVLATLSATSNSNTFYRLQGDSPVVTGFSVLEFYVDCDGTQGYINIDSWDAI